MLSWVSWFDSCQSSNKKKLLFPHLLVTFQMKSAIYDRHNDFLYFNKDDHFRINRRLTGWLLRLLRSADECQRFDNCPNRNLIFFFLWKQSLKDVFVAVIFLKSLGTRLGLVMSVFTTSLIYSDNSTKVFTRRRTVRVPTQVENKGIT